MISIPMTTNELMAAIEKLIARKGTVLTPKFEGATYGHLHIPELDCDYAYQPAAGVMTFLNLEKHGVTKLLGEEGIKKRMIKLLGDLNCSSDGLAPDTSVDITEK